MPNGLGAWLTAGLMIAAALALRCWPIPFNTDTSWLLTLGEKWLGGEVPYLDFVEVNPPASILLYMPAVLLGHWLGVKPESCVDALTFLVVLAMIALAARILSGAGQVNRRSAPWLLAGTLFIFLVLPAYSFSQREHLAAALALPGLAAYLAAFRARPAAIRHQILAGLAGGLCVAIKPYFGLVFGLPLAFVLIFMPTGIRARLSTAFAPVNLMIALVALLYAASVAVFFPAFLSNTLPLVVTLYLPIRVSLFLLLAWAFKSWAVPFLLIRVVEPNRIAAPATAILLLAAAGFAIALIVQGKAWPYHALPVLMFSLLALVEVLSERMPAGPWPARLIGAGIAGLALTGYAFWFFAQPTYSVDVIAEVRRLAPPRPRILTITDDIAFGHPLVRELGGQWVDHLSSHWVTSHGRKILLDDRTLSTAQRDVIEAYVKADEASLANDITMGRPDVILLEKGWWQEWVATTPRIAAALADYREAEVVETTVIMLRRP